MRILETARLIIRYFAEEDTPLVFRYSQEKCTKEELPDEVFDSLEETEEFISYFIEQYEKKSYPLVYAVELKDSGVLIGHVSLSLIEGGKVEIGYAIATEYQGNGYATELVKPFTRWAKETLKLESIYGIVKSKNIASRKCLEKAGFIFHKEEMHKLFDGTFQVRIYVY